MRSKAARGCRRLKTEDTVGCAWSGSPRKASRSLQHGKFNCRLSFDAATAAASSEQLLWPGLGLVLECLGIHLMNLSQCVPATVAETQATPATLLPIALLLSLSAKLVFFLSIGDFDCSKRPAQDRTGHGDDIEGGRQRKNANISIKLNKIRRITAQAAQLGVATCRGVCSLSQPPALAMVR